MVNEHITNELQKLGCKTSYKGFKYLSEAINIVYHAERFVYLRATVYPELARKFDVNQYSIERDIRTVVENCNLKNLQEVSGYSSEDKPTVKRFIYLLAGYISL